MTAKIIPLFEVKEETKCSFCGEPVLKGKGIDNGQTGQSKKAMCSKCIVLADIKMKESE